MYELSMHWSAFVVPMYDIVKHFMAEMYAYSMAAAHLGLAHQTAKSLMISNAVAPNEGWDMFDGDDQLRDSRTMCAILGNEVSMRSQARHRPYLLHYCQTYAFGNHTFSKYNFAGGSITQCDTPLFEVPESDVMDRFNYSRRSSTSVSYYDFSDPKQSAIAHRHVYALCSIIAMANRAGINFRMRNCPSPQASNFNQTWSWLSKSP
uniref:Uncharacterized protein n=1 Tax=Craspedostauros australis TaxID=1486917 RepID=A0A7R9WUY1_9STRA|mmetsp:Transcript_19112/g.53099  ORF Transcript_19112/g.53099 Transcript_19112/m.53099 type:complete len:206 (+) Transcript_19112:95-712(+)